MKQLKHMHQQHGLHVFSKHDIEKIFPEEPVKTLEKSLMRCVKDGMLIHAARGVYVSPFAHSYGGRMIEVIAKRLRPGHYSYVSLESMLAEYGIISQIPVDRLTVMTSGASGIHETPYGVIEFTHTKRSIPDILERSIYCEERPLRIAKKKTAIQDLLRVGRNTHMINFDESDLNDE